MSREQPEHGEQSEHGDQAEHKDQPGRGPAVSRFSVPETAEEARAHLLALARCQNPSQALGRTAEDAPALESLERMRRRYAPSAPGNGRPASVLILFGMVEGQLSVLLTQRADTLRTHAGQVAFPGGAQDPEDADAAAAAVREAWEETGLDGADFEVFGALDPIPVPISGFHVTPVLAWWDQPRPLEPVDPAETARVFTVPVAELADDASRVTTLLTRDAVRFKGPGFTVRGTLVWGFTGYLLEAVLEQLAWVGPAEAQPPKIDPIAWRPNTGR